VAFKVWDSSGRVLYSTDTATIGQTFPMHEPLARALQGQVAAHISELEEAENAPQGRTHDRLIEIYSPIRLGNTDRIVAAAEFYQTVDNLEQELAASQRRSWLIVSAVMLTIYLLLAVFVRQTSRATEALHERVRRAAADSTASNEGFLRRTSAELHDGPIQDIGFALLRLDHVLEQAETLPAANAPGALPQGGPQASAQAGGQFDDLAGIQASLQRAMGEVRAISRGMSLPQLAELSLEDTARRAVRDHERRTATSVRLQLEPLPTQASTALKMSLYRLLQEGLANAVRHAGGQGQAVQILQERGAIRLEIMDEGPGFNPQQASRGEHHLGLAGMRDRAESLGGTFEVVSAPGRGTRIVARLPLIQEEGRNGR
jgi:signal transduction histidine kinase